MSSNIDNRAVAKFIFTILLIIAVVVGIAVLIYALCNFSVVDTVIDDATGRGFLPVNNP